MNAIKALGIALMLGVTLLTHVCIQSMEPAALPITKEQLGKFLVRFRWRGQEDRIDHLLDVYEKDPLGMLSITEQAIVERDEFVFNEAMSRNIPIVMVLSGGYHADSYSIIGKSITNLWNKLLVKTRTS